MASLTVIFLLVLFARAHAAEDGFGQKLAQKDQDQKKEERPGLSRAWHDTYGTFKSRWHATVLHSAVEAMAKLPNTREERANRIFVPMLSNRNLCCMLKDFSAKVGQTTPLDVVVFTVGNAGEAAFNATSCAGHTFSFNLAFLPVREHWGAHPRVSTTNAHDRGLWPRESSSFGDSYRRMGHWRLAFQFAFADLLGYRYLWQLDDDGRFGAPVSTNMLEYMQDNDLWVAAYVSTADPYEVTWGLPELARLFLVAERYEPIGPLFKRHTTPLGLEGLYTVRHSIPKEFKNEAGGWDRMILYGNNIIMDLEKFWWPAVNQRFVELVLQTGYYHRFRWIDQAVIGMMVQLFVPEERLRVGGLPMQHQHPYKWGSC